MMQKLKDPGNRLYLIGLGGVILFYLIYKIYVWIGTESTDNAYLDGYITTLSPEVSGIIEQMNFTDNQLVTKGTVLAKIKDIKYKAAYEEASSRVDAGKITIAIAAQNILLTEIKLAKAQDHLGLTQFQLETSERELNRVNKLAQDNFSTKKMFDDANSRYQTALNDLHQAKLDISSAQQTLKLQLNQKILDEFNLRALEEEAIRAKSDYESTTLIAPIDGVITSSALRLGGYVQASRPVAYIIPEGQYYVKANYKETQVESFHYGMVTEIEFDALRGKKFTGRIRSIYPATGSKFSLIPTDNATGNFTKVVQRVPVLIDIDIPEAFKDKVRLGMSATVDIKKDQK